MGETIGTGIALRRANTRLAPLHVPRFHQLSRKPKETWLSGRLVSVLVCSRPQSGRWRYSKGDIQNAANHGPTHGAVGKPSRDKRMSGVRLTYQHSVAPNTSTCIVTLSRSSQGAVTRYSVGSFNLESPMRTAVLVLTTLALSATGALAADQPSSNSPRAACKTDVEKLCSGVQPGGGRIAACLRQNDAQLSAACKDAFAHARQKKTPQGPSSPQG